MAEAYSFGTWLKQRRRVLGLTQAELARQVGCATVTLQKIELDERRPSTDIAERLAEAVQIAPDERTAFLKSARGELAADQLTLAEASEPAPPWRAVARSQHNLPTALTPLIGRDHELVTVGVLLRDPAVRLVTLTGPGGTGKTRLATAGAAELFGEFPDGVWLVELAPLGDPVLVPSTIVQVLGIKESGGRSLLESLKVHLREKHLLLVLDNFEHMLVAAPVVSELLAAAPQLKVLVTSQSLLHLYGEHQVPVPPLGFPDIDLLPPLDLISSYAAVALFIQRARAVKPDFALTSASAAAVVGICARLDGIPLAIELAAARLRIFPAQALLARLDHRLTALTGGARDRPVRQQSLRGTIDWSYQLLDPAEQRLFARLGVFAGGCSPEAAEAVCGEPEGAEGDVLDGLVSLVDKSLVRQQEGADGEPRFMMLESIREYALERLAASGEAQAVQGWHGAYFLALAEQAEPELTGPHQVEWLDRLEAEHDNLRAALRGALERNEVEMALRLGGALSLFWSTHGHVSEGRRWLATVLERAALAVGVLDGAAERARSAALAKVLQEAGWLAFFQGDCGPARGFSEESLAISREFGDKQGSAYSLMGLGYVASIQGDYGAARAFLQESLAISRELGDKLGSAQSLMGLGGVAGTQGDYGAARAFLQDSLAIMRELGDKQDSAQSLTLLGNVALDQGDSGTARAFYEKSLAISRELGNKQGSAQSLMGLGNVASNQGDYGAARAFLQESLAISREFGDKHGSALSLMGLGNVAGTQGDYGAARAFLQDSLAISRELGDKQGSAQSLGNLGVMALYEHDDARARSLLHESLAVLHSLGNTVGMAWCLEGLAGVAGAQHHPTRAARLWGMADALRTDTGVVMPEVDRARFERMQAAARAQLDEAAWTTAWAEGQAMTLEQAIAYALEQQTGGDEPA